MNDQTRSALRHAADGCKSWAAALTEFAGVFSALSENALPASSDELTISIRNPKDTDKPNHVKAAVAKEPKATKGRKSNVAPKEPKGTPVVRSKKAPAAAKKTPVVPAVKSTPVARENGADNDADADMEDDEEEDGDSDSDMDRPISAAAKKNQQPPTKKSAPAPVVDMDTSESAPVKSLSAKGKKKGSAKKPAAPKAAGVQITDSTTDGGEGKTTSFTPASRKKKPAKKATNPFEAPRAVDDDDSVSTKTHEDPEMDTEAMTTLKKKTKPTENDKDADEDENESASLKKKPRGKSTTANNLAAKEKASPKSRLKKQPKAAVSKKKKDDDKENEGNTVPVPGAEEESSSEEESDIDDLPLHRSTKKKKAPKNAFASAKPVPPPAEGEMEDVEVSDVEVSESESYIVDESDEEDEGGANGKMQTMDEMLSEVTKPQANKRKPDEDGEEKRVAKRRKPATGGSAVKEKRGPFNDPEKVEKAIREVLLKDDEPRTKKYIMANAKAAHNIPLTHLNRGIDQLIKDETIVKKGRGLVLADQATDE